jgi:hypothetical protein
MVGRETRRSRATSLSDSSGACTSTGLCNLCDLMAASETPRKGSATSADTTGESVTDAVLALRQVRTEAAEGQVWRTDARPQTYDAARILFAAIQDELVRLGGVGTTLRQGSRRDAGSMIELAFRAVEEVEGARAKAKHLQLEATGGEPPLGVCVGKRARAGALLPFGDGCGLIFVDSRTRFSCYCPGCNRKPGGRKREKVLSHRKAAATARFAVSEGWSIACTGCGKRFVAPTPQRRRCARCRHWAAPTSVG